MGARHSISEMIRYLCFLLLLYFSKLPTMNENADWQITDHGVQRGCGWDTCWCHTGTGPVGTEWSFPIGSSVCTGCCLSLQKDIYASSTDRSHMWFALCLTVTDRCPPFHILYSDLVCRRQSLECVRVSQSLVSFILIAAHTQH